MPFLSPPPKMQFFDLNGDPLSGGKVYTYAQGTTTPLETYTDSAGTTPNTNPVVLDSEGQAAIWFKGLPYSLQIYNAAGVLQGSSGDLGIEEDPIPDIRQFGASTTATAAQNTAAIEEAIAASASGVVGVYDGEYETTYSSITTPNTIGTGTLITDAGANKRAVKTILIDEQPPSLANGGGITSDFNNEFAYKLGTTQIVVTGADTLGTVPTGYNQSNAVCPDYTRVHFASGHNEASGSLEGRTAWAAKRVNITHDGSGDVSVLNANMFMSNNEGYGSLLGEPAALIISGQISCGTDDVIMNIIEINQQDNGYDVVAKGPVYNFFRTNDTRSKGQFWTGIRCQSLGSKNADSAFQPVGNWNNGLDTTCMSTDRAVTLKDTQRITFDAVDQNLPGAPGYLTWGIGGSTYIAKETIAMVFKYEGVLAIGYTDTYVAAYKQLSLTNGAKAATDGVGSMGTAGGRFSVVYAVSGTINTSDENEKTLIDDIPESWLVAARNIKPCRFKFKDAVAQKGDAARWHVGYIAQQVFQALNDAGVSDPWECSFLCRDALEVTEEDGTVAPLIDEETGEQKERWGLRYEELLALKLAAM